MRLTPVKVSSFYGEFIMTTAVKNHVGITQMLAKIACAIDVWAGGFKFTLTRRDGSTRTFSFQVPDHYWVELTPTGPVQVSDQAVREAVEAVFNEIR